MNQQLFYGICLIGIVYALLVQPASAQISLTQSSIFQSSSLQDFTRRRLRELPVTTAELLSQVPNSPIVEVTGVKANPTDKGIELILQTTQGQQLQITNRSANNNFVADVPNAQLRLPSGDAFTFRSEKPVKGITEIIVTNFDANTIRVTVQGEASLPAVELFDSPDEGLIFSVASPASSTPQAQKPQTQQPQPNQSESETQPEQPSAEGDQPIELVVTGERDGYSVPDASTATRTDTPLRDIPQSIQVVPRQVLDDQQVIRASDALRNVSGVQRTGTGGNATDLFTIRGFQQFGSNLRDGFKDYRSGFTETANLERIEVLKGPASVLYGNLDPGGAINFVTKQPLAKPFYGAEFQAGSFGLVRPTFDFSGPLNSKGNLLYRLNTAYERGGNFRDFDQDVERYFVSPVVSWQIADRTKLTFEFEYLDDRRPIDRGLIAVGTGVADIPFDRVLGERDDVTKTTQFLAGYRLEHGFNDSWTLRNRFQFASSENRVRPTSSDSLDEETGVLDRSFFDNTFDDKIYALQTDLVGKFSTSSVKHTLVFGVDLVRQTNDSDIRSDVAPSINIFNPIYGTVTRPSRNQLSNVFTSQTQTNTLGIYLQDQIALAENLKLLLGGRFDLVDQRSTSDGSESQQQDDAFTPRIGIVYQPIQPISLYANFSQSFQPNSGTRVDGSLLEPERGTQYEVGIRGEFLNSKLIANLAAYEITKSNVSAIDPDNPDFVISVGEQRSRGIELDVAGEILPGWNIIGSYAYTDANVTEDSDVEGNLKGNILTNVPFNAASLWTTYELQTGNLKGLGFGLGIFYVGERQGDLGNSFKLPSYVRTDASIFYRRDNWKLGLNFNNLFNVDYIETSFRRTDVYPGAPFTVLGTISVEF
ncbi:TonB-dependent receptor [Nostoc sp.]|uniref:TonB-dependent receptor n=1 Tax=Nostoc sp. TaxID=1180 RepID=UPI002FF630D9